MQPKIVYPRPASEIAPRIRQVFVRDLVLPCRIGAYRHERSAPQRVRINVNLAVLESDAPIDDQLANVVSYEKIIEGVRRVAQTGHINLVETLAERVAALSLSDPRVRSVRVRVEKLDVFPDAGSVGVEIERHSAFG
ncbi:MAG TPA: dihydroneopterin aldolase [Alphaproteobacteria bacterium]|jgi:dihydroneopterin aldolase|nr:dihydroneopterin aldolase [Alphaproteobacteria bacterium]